MKTRCFILFQGNAEMTDLFKCKKSGTICCAPKSRIHEVQGLMHRNDTSFPVFVNPQTQQQIPQYLPNNNVYPNGYQAIPPNVYAPIPNAYQPLPPQASIPNNYPIPPATNYITQPQQVPQQAIITSNYVPVAPQNYAPVPPNNVYPQNVVINPNVNLAPAYSTPGNLTLPSNSCESF